MGPVQKCPNPSDRRDLANEQSVQTSHRIAKKSRSQNLTSTESGTWEPKRLGNASVSSILATGICGEFRVRHETETLKARDLRRHIQNSAYVRDLDLNSPVRPRAQESLAFLASLLSVLGMLLAAAGLFGVMSYGVTRRTRKIGARMAVHDAAALALSGVLSSLVYGISARNPFILGAACIAVIAMAIAASALRALCATNMEPTEALRVE